MVRRRPGWVLHRPARPRRVREMVRFFFEHPGTNVELPDPARRMQSASVLGADPRR
jgi:hypothetical protein